MRPSQQIFRVRRQYNTWVGNQTLEDYSLRFTAKSARHRTIDSVAKTALGATAFLALEALAATVTLNYGFTNALWAMLTVALVIFSTGLPISYYAAKHGLDIDLLTRGAGFGYLGSTLTSLIYASFTFIFFAIEAAILASALKAMFGLPLQIGYVFCALAVVPIVTHGITAISRFQIGSQPIWLLLQCSALLIVAVYEYQQIDDWVQYTPAHIVGGQEFNLALFGAATSILFAMVAQIGEQVDYLRFLPEKNNSNKKQWWFWLILAGPGWISIGLIKMLFGSFLAYLAVKEGASLIDASDPTLMYQRVFILLTESPWVSLMLAGVFVIISQMKINVTNAYAGSIAWSNFFARLTHNHPGRVVWLVFNVLIALILMELGIYRALEAILGLFAIVAISWLSCLAADLLINMNLGLRPKHIEFKRAHLYDINPVGVVSMLLASTIGVVCYLNYFGDTFKYLAHFISIAVSFVSVPAIAWITGGKYYLAREIPVVQFSDNDANLDLNVEHQAHHANCCICENDFDAPDMSFCPAYQGNICSLCCSLDGRCLDVCKPQGRFSNQFYQLFAIFLPKRLLDLVSSRVGKFIGIFSCINLLSAIILSLIHYHMDPVGGDQQYLLTRTLWTLYFVLMIVVGVIAWLFLLTQESRNVAQQESNRQTRLLIEEIEAHKETDKSLQKAKELAERANHAKSRYLTGISHELRTPLQSISGYAQLLSQSENTLPHQQKGLNIIRRNSDYLADLIEGLLDISKIEAGRLDIYRNHIRFIELIDQLEEMFTPIAESNGIEFRCTRIGSIPSLVIADEKRIRQILINLLSNAVKYTKEGYVEFSVQYRNEVAEFSIRDTGVGIHNDDIKRILDPFERVRTLDVPNVKGTGLGLTIVRLLTDIMGGDFKVHSELGKGSEFIVSLLLSQVYEPRNKVETPKTIYGYEGEKLTILAVDDEAIHRGLIADLLLPLGFNVLEAPDANAAIELVQHTSPDLFILDISMPGKNGLELAGILRKSGFTCPIVMLSADLEEIRMTKANNSVDYDAYLVKPMNNRMLLDTLAETLNLEWNYEPPKLTMSETTLSIATIDKPLTSNIAMTTSTLISNAEIGFYRGTREALEQLIEDKLLTGDDAEHAMTLVEKFEFIALIQWVKDKIS